MTENNELENVSEDIEIPEPEIIKEPNPWDDAPTGVWFYDIQYEDGRLGNMTRSAESAYKRGWDLSNNIPVEDVQVSDINYGYYPKELCPMKTEEDHLRDQYRLEIQQLKKALSDTDYKAIKYAEGQISEEEYASVKAERQGYRDRINYLRGAVMTVLSKVCFCVLNAAYVDPAIVSLRSYFKYNDVPELEWDDK